ncbi:MAG: hypothetical protein FWH21_04850 [Kiritimatiellaeota bacterium]|nr:hypothetical protein [Kiritimatiellota bacterium]
MNTSFREAVEEICQKDSRYLPEAYVFLVEALDMTMKTVRKVNPNHGQHVTGKELLEGIRSYALAEFGPMTHAVFSEWGVHTTLDFGAIVFNLIENDRLGKTETDSIEDFRGVFAFEDAFLKPFEPQGKGIRKTGDQEVSG